MGVDLAAAGEVFRVGSIATQLPAIRCPLSAASRTQIGGSVTKTDPPGVRRSLICLDSIDSGLGEPLFHIVHRIPAFIRALSLSWPLAQRANFRRQSLHQSLHFRFRELQLHQQQSLERE